MATKVFDLYAEISLDNSSYIEGLKTSENAGKSFESSLKDNTSKTKTGFDTLSTAVSACKTVLSTIGIGFTMDKVIKGLSEAYEEANKLDEKLRGASTLYGSVAVDQTKLVNNLKSISLQTGESLEALGQTVYDAMSAGVQPTEDMADVLQVVSASSKLAKAGFTDTNTAMKASLSVINAYGMGIENVSKVSDILLNTQNLGVTTVGELSNALSKVTPVASAFGVSIENVTSALALMTKQGTNTEVASTGLSSILSELGKSGTTASENLQKASLSAGLTETSFKDLLASGKSLGDILGIMSDYAEQNNLSLVDMFSSIEAGKSALQITNAGAEEFNKTLDSMETATGLVSESFEKMVTPSQRLDSAIATLKTTIGEKFKPTIDSAKTALADLLTKMTGQVDYSSTYETTLNNLAKASENLKKAQKGAGDEINATTIAMQFQSRVDFWSGISKASTQYDSLNKTIKSLNSQLQVQEGIVSINEETIAKAVEDSKLSLEDLMNRLAMMKEGKVDVDIPYVTDLTGLMGAFEKISENKAKVDELKAQIENAQSATENFVTSLAEMVSKGVISVSDISLINTNLASEVQKTIDTLSKEVGVVAPLDVVPQKIEEVVKKTNGDIEESASTTVDTLLKKLSLMEKKIEDDFPNVFDEIKKDFDDTTDSITNGFDTLSNVAIGSSATLKNSVGDLFYVDTRPIALATTEFSKASKSILSDTESTKVEIYTQLKDLSEEYELTVTDMTILSQAKAKANREIWKNFADGFMADMESTFYSVTASFEDLGEALVNGEDAWQSFGSIAIKALTQILESLGNQLAVMAVSKALMGDWAGAVLAGGGAVLAYTTAGVTNAKGMEMLEKLGVDTEEEEKTDKDKTTDKGTEPTKPKTEEEVKEEKISSLEEQIAMLEALVDNKEQGVEIPEQYQQDAKIRELQDRIRELEGRLNETKEVTVVQNINTVPMTPYELEQQAYIMAERLQWS